MKGNNTFQKSLKLKGKQMTKGYKFLNWLDIEKPLVNQILDSDLRHALHDWVDADSGQIVNVQPPKNSDESKIHVVYRLEGHNNLDFLDALFLLLFDNFQNYTKETIGVEPKDLLDVVFSITKEQDGVPVFLTLDNPKSIAFLEWCIGIYGAESFILADSGIDKEFHSKIDTAFPNLERLESWETGEFWDEADWYADM